MSFRNILVFGAFFVAGLILGLNREVLVSKAESPTTQEPSEIIVDVIDTVEDVCDAGTGVVVSTRYIVKENGEYIVDAPKAGYNGPPPKHLRLLKDKDGKVLSSAIYPVGGK